MDQKKQKAALALKKGSEHSAREICDIVGIARNTYYKYTCAEDQPPPRQRRGSKPPADLPVVLPG